MVCCVVCVWFIPLVLWLWHKYLQPLVSRFLGPLPWVNQEAVSDENKEPPANGETTSIAKPCCPFSSKLNCSKTNGVVANGHSPHEDDDSNLLIQNKKSD